MAGLRGIHAIWIPAIHAGMTVYSNGIAFACYPYPSDECFAAGVLPKHVGSVCGPGWGNVQRVDVALKPIFQYKLAFALSDLHLKQADGRAGRGRMAGQDSGRDNIRIHQ
jgi:hypothetical protein